MRIYNLVSFLVSILVLTSCARTPDFREFDPTAWKADTHGCQGVRKGLAESLLKEKSLLLAHDELDVVDALGKPDAHEIYKRSEKFFYYSIDPDSTCITGSVHARKLVIRFNAVGLAKEIIIE